MKYGNLPSQMQYLLTWLYIDRRQTRRHRPAGPFRNLGYPNNTQKWFADMGRQHGFDFSKVGFRYTGKIKQHLSISKVVDGR